MKPTRINKGFLICSSKNIYQIKKGFSYEALYTVNLGVILKET